MYEDEKHASSLIDELLKRAKEDKEYQAWKAEHPEIDVEIEAMTREEKIAYIIDALEKLGLVKPEEEEEPETDSTDTEEQEDTTHATDEDEEAIFDMLLGGYDKALEEIGARVYEDVFNRFTSLTGYAKAAPISFMFLGYSAGFTHGMEAMSKITEAIKADEAK